MQDVPLTIGRILAHGSTVHHAARVVTWTGGEPERRTFAEIGVRAAQLAHALAGALGVGSGEPVATLMWNNSEHLEAYLAVPSMGAVVHTLNPRLPVDQLIWIINHAEDRVVLVNGSLLPLLAGVLPHLKSVEHVVVAGPGDRAPLQATLAAMRTEAEAQAAPGTGSAARTPELHDYQELLAGRPTEYDWPEVDERSAAGLCYSSGTTGHPKGVAYSHRSIYLHAMQGNMTESFGTSWRDMTMPVVPMFHVNAWGIPHAAFMGGTSLLLPDRFLQPAPLAEMITAERPNCAAAVPTIWAGLLAEMDTRGKEQGHDISSLRQVVIGGAACPPALMRAYQERYGVRVLHAWGMTETSPLGAVAVPPAGLPDADADADAEWAYRTTQGRFPCGVQARLVGPDGSVLPHDGAAAGELEVRGPWITGSYYNGAHGIPEPGAEEGFHDGWLRTGDVGTISADGYLVLTDRAKDVIKSGGEWISSMQLENHLMGHPAVAEAAVIAVPDPEWGERPLAAVVFRSTDEDDAEQFAALRDFLAGRIARWQVPERWARIDEVPKTSVGKFDKKVLRSRFAHGELEVTDIPRPPA
jgi:fatty-acyl-CoA synthase